MATSGRRSQEEDFCREKEEEEKVDGSIRGGKKGSDS